jgi:hypothetical protein
MKAAAQPPRTSGQDTRSEFSKFARFPNATNWGLRGSLNVSKFFDPRDDVSPAWRPGGYFERAWSGAWTGPYVNAGRNWSALIPEITYMKTRTLADDLNYDGFDVQVKWKGGSRNNYGGTAVLVDSIRVPNPYAIALLYDYVNDELRSEDGSSHTQSSQTTSYGYRYTAQPL